ncbi:MAG: hypothetical protein P4K83_01590 [Terracidiphilus sp.]|nr:hypothetical protein [Terracidiphilus sp.]
MKQACTMRAWTIATVLAVGAVPVPCQTVASQAVAPQAVASLTRIGQIVVAGRPVEFAVRHLPVNAFPALPGRVATELNRRGCTIPQTYEAHRPENVVRASLERAGSEDWAVLCSSGGTVTLLVFFAGSGEPAVLATAQETERLQAHDPSGVLGFNWGIDPATPEQVYQAQSGLRPRPARLDHEALADAVVEHRTVYHFHAQGAWTLVAMPD